MPNYAVLYGSSVGNTIITDDKEEFESLHKVKLVEFNDNQFVEIGYHYDEETNTFFKQQIVGEDA